MKYWKLRGKIREMYKTEDAFAKAVGFSNVQLSRRLNGGIRWNEGDMKKVMNALGCDISQVCEYFFED